MRLEEEKLRYRGRYLRTQSGKLLLGPTGDRLFVDYLDKKPGFSGRIDFIHKCNIPELFHVEAECSINFGEAIAEWYPSYLHMSCESPEIQFAEDKWITQDDVAVSRQTWKNISQKMITLRLVPAPNSFYHFGRMPHGYHVGMALCAEAFSKEGTYHLSPGETLETAVCAGIGNEDSEDGESIRRRTEKASTSARRKDALEKQKNYYQKFFEAIPSFSCSSELLNRVWNYRWYILRNSWAVPAFGNLPRGVMYEGRSHKMAKMPLQAKGWEFTRLIPLSTPFHIQEMKWRSDTAYVEDMVQSLLDSEDDAGLFRVTSVDDYGASYANAAHWAIYQYALVHTDTAKNVIDSWLPKLEKCLNARELQYTDGKDSLQIEKVHQLTGKEYQPSYWYFHQYPEDCWNPETYTWLKRVDSSVYHYLNEKGMAGLFRLCGNVVKADQWENKARTLAESICNKMWDEETGFFYDLHWKTGEKAMVKNIVGFYPFWAQLTSEAQLRSLEFLSNPKTFGTPFPYPSVAADCPAYSPAGGWRGHFIKGRDGCVWDGPSWPYTNAIILDMLGKQSKLHRHRYDTQFAKGLQCFAEQHFRDGDMERPYLVEHYNPETGELLSDEADYNHSFFIDLIVTHVLGITVKENCVEIDPLKIGLQWARCEGIYIRGHRIDLFFESGKEEFCRVILDGGIFYQGNYKEKLLLPL